MTTTPPETDPGPDQPAADQPPTYSYRPGPRVGRADLRDVTRLRRTVGPDRTFAGVSGGLGRYLDVDPLILKVAFVVLSFFGGAGLFLYGALWVLLPEDGSERATIDLDQRSLTVALVGVGGLAAVFLIGGWSGEWWFPWPLAVIGLIVAVFLVNRGSRTAAPMPLGSDGQPVAAPYGALPTGAPPASGYGAPDYPVVAPYAPASRPRDPRKRGPLLFWFTGALVTLALGVLGMVDVSGVDLPHSSYPALAVGLIGLMLVVGAFYGRAGGLILVGLLGTAALAGATIAENVGQNPDVLRVPTSAAAVESGYDFERADFVLDLTQVDDLEELDGQTISVTGEIGRIQVIVPEGLGVDATARIDGPGTIRVFGATDEGFESYVTQQSVDPGAPRIDLDAEIDLGAIEITYDDGTDR